MRSAILRGGMWLGCCAAWGCGGAPTATATADMSMATAATDMAMAPATEVCMPDGTAVALAAHYGIRATLNVNVKVPSDCTDADSCVYDADARSLLFMLADAVQTGSSVTMTVHPCSIEIPQVGLKGQNKPTVLTAAPSLVQSVKPVTSTAALVGTGGATDTCSTLTVQPLAILIGARLSSPATDPLPSFVINDNPPVPLCGGLPTVSCDDATDFGCICDQEKDGVIGATVTASGVPGLTDVDQVDIALRTVVSLDGAVFPPSAGQATPGQRIRGDIAGLTLDQSPVGCHHAGTGGEQPYPCTDLQTSSVAMFNPKLSQSVNTGSTFVAMPVDATVTCDQLVAEQTTLFKGQ